MLMKYTLAELAKVKHITISRANACDRAESLLRLLTRDIVLRKSSRFHSRSSLPASL